MLVPQEPGLPTRSSSPPVFWSIVEESLDEAEFLWHRRRQMLAAHDQTLDTVEKWVEDRLMGALDGLTVGGEAGITLVLGPALGSEEPSRVAVAAYALLASGIPQAGEAFRTAFLSCPPERLTALRRGLELVPVAVDALAPVMKDRSPAVVAAFLEACAFQRKTAGQEIRALVASPNVEVQRAAARLLRFAPRPVQEACYAYALGLPDPEARDWAVESNLIAGFPQAQAVCRDLAGAELHASARMLLLLAMIGSAADQKIVVAALGDEARQASALWALGFGGRREGADSCIEMLAQERQVKLAAEAFCAITGLDLEAAGLTVPTPPESDELIAFEQEDLDADLEPKPEDLLPMPDIAGVIAWWNKQRSRFDGEARFQAGRPATTEVVQELLANGPTRRRHAWAVELAIRTQGRVQVETWAFVPDQRQQMVAAAHPSPDGQSAGVTPPVKPKRR